MATSGTVGQTVIDNATLIEHAVRRCGLPAGAQTAENSIVARNCLFILAAHLASRGLNLWCVTREILGLEAGRTGYTLLPGTISVMNVLYTAPTLLTGTDTTTATALARELAEAAKVIRVGFKLSSLPASGGISIDSSDDGVVWTPRKVVAQAALPVAGAWHHLDLDPSVTALHFRISSASALTVSAFSLCSDLSEVPMTPFNRDDFANLPNKRVEGRSSTNYFFEKKITPTLTLWPVPTVDTDHVSYWRHHQIEDVGSLQQELAIPTRWLESFIVHLAFRLSMELPGVDPSRISLLSGLADKAIIEVEAEETDGNPIYFVPRISAYTGG